MKQIILSIITILFTATALSAQTYRLDGCIVAEYSEYSQDYEFTESSEVNLHLVISRETNQFYITSEQRQLYNLLEPFRPYLFPTATDTAYTYKARDINNTPCVIQFTNTEGRRWVSVFYSDVVINYRIALR